MVSVRAVPLAVQRRFRSSVAQLSAHYTPNANNLLNAKPFCAQLTGLSPGQHRICDLFVDHMPAVGHGAKEAITVTCALSSSAFVNRGLSGM